MRSGTRWEEMDTAPSAPTGRQKWRRHMRLPHSLPSHANCPPLTPTSRPAIPTMSSWQRRQCRPARPSTAIAPCGPVPLPQCSSAAVRPVRPLIYTRRCTELWRQQEQNGGEISMEYHRDKQDTAPICSGWSRRSVRPSSPHRLPHSNPKLCARQPPSQRSGSADRCSVRSPREAPIAPLTPRGAWAGARRRPTPSACPSGGSWASRPGAPAVGGTGAGLFCIGAQQARAGALLQAVRRCAARRPEHAAESGVLRPNPINSPQRGGMQRASRAAARQWQSRQL